MAFDIALALDDASGNGPDVAIDAPITSKTRNSRGGLEGLGVGRLFGGVDLRVGAMLVGSESNGSRDADDKGHRKNNAAICGRAETLLWKGRARVCNEPLVAAAPRLTCAGYTKK